MATRRLEWAEKKGAAGSSVTHPAKRLLRGLVYAEEAQRHTHKHTHVCTQNTHMHAPTHTHTWASLLLTMQPRPPPFPAFCASSTMINWIWRFRESPQQHNALSLTKHNGVCPWVKQSLFLPLFSYSVLNFPSPPAYSLFAFLLLSLLSLSPLFVALWL